LFSLTIRRNAARLLVDQQQRRLHVSRDAVKGKIRCEGRAELADGRGENQIEKELRPVWTTNMMLVRPTIWARKPIVI